MVTVSLILLLSSVIMLFVVMEHKRKLAREKRIAEAVRAGEREAAAIFLEYYEQSDLARYVREGAHLAQLVAKKAKRPRKKKVVK